MKIKKSFKSAVKCVVAILAVLLLLAGGASWYLSYRFKPAINKGLVELISRSTNGLYKVKFSNIHLNFITASASISDVVITPDTARYRALVAAQKAPDNVYTVKLAKLQIRNFRPWLIYREKVLKISKLIFQQPQITMVNKHYDFNDDRPPRPRTPPYQFIAGKLRALSIGEVRFNNAHFKYVDANGNQLRADSVSKFNIRCSDYLIDPRSADDPSRLYLFKEIAFSLKKYRYITPDKFYMVTADNIQFTTNGGKLEIDAFLLQPQHSEARFGKVAGYSRDRYTINVSTIKMQGLDLPLYIKRQEVFANEMFMENGKVAVFSDNRLPDQPMPTIGRFPHQLLQRLSHPITIGKIGIRGIGVEYAEFDRDSKQKGVITFEETSGQVMHLSNHPRAIAGNGEMKVSLRTHMMGAARMDVNFIFKLGDPAGAFSYSGMLHAMDGRQINKITKPLGMVQVNRGDVKKLQFAVRANDKRAIGSMTFLYHDLAVSMLKKDPGREKLVRQGWVSFLANNLILESHNPIPGQPVRVAPLQYERQPYATFFSYIWRTLFYGIKYSVGITPQKEAKIQAQIDRFEEIREDRMERKKRRAERGNR